MRYRGRTIGFIFGGLLGIAAAWLEAGTEAPAKAYTVTFVFTSR